MPIFKRFSAKTSEVLACKMAEQPITQRCTKLLKVLSNNNATDERNWRLSNEALLDAFIVLFDECCSEHLQKDKHVVEFVKKCK